MRPNLARVVEPFSRGSLLAIVCALSACTRTLSLDDALTTVAYDLQASGRILVDVLINDRGPYRFALDTAASISLIFDDARTELDLELVPDASATVRGAIASGRFPIVTIERMQVGSEIWTDAEIVSLPSRTGTASRIDGILGNDFLRRYGVGFSTRNRVVRLYLPDVVSARAYRGWASIPLEPISVGATSEPLYYFDVTIGGRSIPALFDLGAGLNMINSSGARELRLVAVERNQGVLLSDAIENERILARLSSEEVSTAGVRWRNEVFLIADLEIFETLRYEDRPLAILGSGLFNQRDFVIDFVHNRLLVRVSMDEVEDPS